MNENKEVLKEILYMEDFACRVAYQISEVLGLDYEAKLAEVQKNNGIKKCGLLLKKKGSSIAISIYLEEYYQEYLAHSDMDIIIHHIVQVFLEKQEDTPKKLGELKYDYESMKDCIIFRLVDYQRNKELLRTVPYLPCLNLAITFQCYLHQKEDDIGTIQITLEHLAQWQVDIWDLYSLAQKNTPRLFPASIHSMEEILWSMVEQDENAFGNHIFDEQNSEREISMYVITNQVKNYGAACILYPEVLKQFAEKNNQDYYVLPSSVHEMILIPYDEAIESEQLKSMVTEINQTQVPPGDILSDDVYLYNRNEQQLSWVTFDHQESCEQDHFCSDSFDDVIFL